MLVETQAAYARRRGVSRQAVAKAVRQGRIPVTADGKVNVAAADAAWVSVRAGQPAAPAPPPMPEAPRPRSGPPARAPGPMDRPLPGTMLHSNTVRAGWLAKMARLEYEKEAGILVPREDVRKSTFEAARQVRAHLMTLPDRVAPGLAMQEAPEIHRTLALEVRRICEELAQWAEKT